MTAKPSPTNHSSAASAPEQDIQTIAGYVSSTRITYLELAELVVSQLWADKDRSAQSFRSNARAWCKHHNAKWTSPAHFTLGIEFQTHVRKFEDDRRDGSPGRTDKSKKNVLTAARHLQRLFAAIQLNDDLPLDFSEALRTLLEQRGWEVKNLMNVIYDKYYREQNPTWYGPQIYSWVNGTGAPGRSWRGDSHYLLRQIEEVFELPPATLVRRAYPTLAPVKLGSGAPIPYRVRKEELKEYPYRMKHLPAQFHDLWIDFVDWRGQESIYQFGEQYVVSDHYRWTSLQTIEIAEARLRNFFGWLCLPLLKPGTPPDSKERWKCGKGMKVEEITLAHIFDTQLLWDYVQFLRVRQHDGKFTHSGLDFLILVNSFVSMPYSFLYSNNVHAQAFREQLGVAPTEWVGHVQVIHESIRKMIGGLRKKIVVSRNADDPLRHVLNDEAPMQLLLEAIECMERDMPPKSRPLYYGSAVRDLVIFRILVELPLRSKNLRNLTIGSSIYKDASSGLWRVFIPKAELKNWASPEAHDIDRTLSSETSDWIDHYVTECRPSLCCADRSEFLLLKSPGGTTNPENRTDDQIAYNANGLRNIISKYTLRYFGARIGTNFFRHALATARLKDNPNAFMDTAALLNNSPNTVLSTYKHLTQADGLRSHENWRQEQIEKHRAAKVKNGGKSNGRK